MRIKDLKVHIVMLFFILVCFVACNIVYDIGLTSVMEKNALAESKNNINNTLSRIEITMSEIELEAGYGVSENLTIINNNNLTSNYLQQFKGLEQAILYNNLIENDAVDGDPIPYLYVRTNIEGQGVIVRFELSYFFEKVRTINREVSTYPLYITDYSGMVYYSNTTYYSPQIYSVLRQENSEEIINSIKAFIKRNDTTEIYSFKVTANKQSGNMSIAHATNLGILLFDFLPASNSMMASSNLEMLRLAYFIGLIILMVLLIIMVISMLRKALGGSGIGSNSSRKTTNIVLVVKGNGKIIKYNRTFRYLFDNNTVPVKNIIEFTNLDELDIKLEINRQGLFKVYYDNPINGRVYMEFLSVKHNNDYTLVGKDITKAHMEELELYRFSSRSSVTNDENSFIFARRYRELRETFKVHKTPYSLIMFNLKGFKEVNTLLGFNSGNEVLKLFSNKLHNQFPEEEVYHLGADEFIVLSLKTKENECIQKSDLILNDLKAPIKINNNEIFLRPAIAILSSDMDEGTKDYDDLMEKIRLAIERAKTIVGRSIVKYDESIENAAKKQRDMEEDLKNAVAKQEFVMYYQPQYHLASERICGFEALIRWNNTKYIGTSPQVYIEMAEKNGYIIDIGNFINSDVFKTAKEMEQYNIHISINVSPAQIVQAGFVADLLAEFEKNQLSQGSIAIEITETFLMENFQVVIEKLNFLKSRGFAVHLDDFGTGYSSMLYLKELPIDTIKIDREFIRHIETDKFSKVLTSKIISLAKELGDKVICEGVETKVQKDIVQKYGADIIQGYYIGKPLNKADAFALLKTGKVASENKTSGDSKK